MTVAGFQRNPAPLDELNYTVDVGSGAVTPTALKAIALKNLGLSQGGAGAGTVTTAATTTAVEATVGSWHRTQINMTNFLVGQIADNAALGIGAKFYTLPAGAIAVRNMVIKGGVTGAVSVTAQTPEVAVGSVIASGAIANTTTTMEDYIDGGANGLIGGVNVAPDVAGTLFAKGALSTSAAPGVYVAATGGKARDMFLNLAATWADVTAAGNATFTGSIYFEWQVL